MEYILSKIVSRTTENTEKNDTSDSNAHPIKRSNSENNEDLLMFGQCVGDRIDVESTASTSGCTVN